MRTMDKRFRPRITKTEVNKFLLVGVPRSGVGIIYSVLDADTRITCHSDVLKGAATDDEAAEEFRRQAHDSYFGAPKRYNPSSPAHYAKNNPNLHRYLVDTLLSRPERSETSLGAKVDYTLLDTHELYEVLEDPDILVIHALRNPVASFTSYQQALYSKVWRVQLGEHTSIPPAVRLDLDELTEFVDRYESVSRKVRAASSRLLEIHFSDITRNYVGTVYRIYRSLGYDDGIPTYRKTQRLPNVTLARRITNFAELVQRAPSVVKHYLQHEYAGG